MHMSEGETETERDAEQGQEKKKIAKDINT
jgi:hypothetical protein